MQQYFLCPSGNSRTGLLAEFMCLLYRRKLKLKTAISVLIGLIFKITLHQIQNCLLRVLALVKHGVYFFKYWHLQAQSSCFLEETCGCPIPLNHGFFANLKFGPDYFPWLLPNQNFDFCSICPYKFQLNHQIHSNQKSFS